MTISSSAEQIDVWCTFCDEVTDTELLSCYTRLLSREEREQQQRFRFQRDRHRYLLTRALTRTVLARYLGVRPADCVFVANPYGRPEISGGNGGELSFNVSHTDGLIVLAVARRRIVGIDVENTLTRESLLDIADRFFSSAEVAALHRLPPERQQARFFEYWTLKESYIKARGMGLSIPLDQFSFHLDDAPDQIRIEIDPRQRDAPGRWQFWQLEVGDRFQVSICVERAPVSESRLQLASAVPLRSVYPLDYSMQRCTRPC